MLTFAEYAVEKARSQNHLQVRIEDLHTAKSQFSDSRLKDLGDEYSENFPQLQLVLRRFFGLGNRFTLSGVRDFIKVLLANEDVKNTCASWIYNATTPAEFISLMYNIGFFGIDNGKGCEYRSQGTKSRQTPPIDTATQSVIHPAFQDALQLRDLLISSLDVEQLREGGILIDLPAAISMTEYHERLAIIEQDLKSLPTGIKSASKYEDLIGDVLRWCFCDVLMNPEAQVRDINGTMRRDWICSNAAITGFWEMVRTKYGAVQVIWECKNFESLEASDFHQIEYYLNSKIGKFGIICFRGEIKKHYYSHIRNIADNKDGLVILLTDKDCLTFIRQSRNGKVKDAHIQDIFDRTLRSL